MFAVLYPVVLRPLPFREAERMVMVWIDDAKRGIREEGVSWVTYRDWLARSRSFEELAARGRNYAILIRGAEPERVLVDVVTANYLPMLGVNPQAGRFFTEQEEERKLKLTQFKDEIRRSKYVYEFRSLDNLRRLVGVALVKTVHAMLFGGKVDQLVFISHSTKDDAFVDLLTAKLHGCGVQTWVDHHNILPGADWDTALESALHASDALIVVLTPPSNRSIVVKAEWSYFGESGKKIYPILLGNTGIPFRLRVLQYTDFQTDPVKAFRRLKDALGVAQCSVADAYYVADILDRCEQEMNAQSATKLLVNLTGGTKPMMLSAFDLSLSRKAASA